MISPFPCQFFGSLKFCLFVYLKTKKKFGFGLRVWKEMPNFFCYMMRTSKVLWDVIHFLVSLSCTTTFKGIPLDMIELD